MEGALFGGRYELQEQLGSGGMARVHRARDTRLGRTVAVKTLHRDLARDPEARTRFAREARAAAVLNHPGIVTVHDQDEVRDDDGVLPYLVMEYIDGVTLERLVKDQAPLDPAYAARITCDVLDALAHAHTNGTVHRDVKPSNVMITRSGAVKVADFGIARVVDATTLTVTGFTVGTPGYMAPEQVLGKPVDARGDVYAVGCVLHELLTGSVPFTGEAPLNVMYAHVHQPAPSPSERNPDVPAALDAIVLHALAKDPKERPTDAATMRTALRDWLRREATAEARTGPIADLVRLLPAAAARRDEPETGGEPEDGPADGAGSAGGAQDHATSDAGDEPTPGAQDARPAPGGDSPGGFLMVRGGGPAAASAPGGFGPPMARPNPPLPSPAPPNPAPPSPAPQPPVQPYPPLPAAPTPLAGPPQPSPWSTPNSTPPQSLHPALSSQPVPPGPPLPPPKPGRRRVRAWMIAAAAVVVAGSLVVGQVVFHPFDKDEGGSDEAKLIQQVMKGRKSASGFDAALGGVVNISEETGGTVKLISDTGPGTLDPAASYDTLAWNLQRIFLRKLVDYAPRPGDAGRVLEPDLATDTGQVSSDGKTYTFTLKENIRFEDGTPITARDIEYGIERSFKDEYAGPKHLVELLDQGQNYPGPSGREDGGLDAVETPNDRTITFHLKDPYPDFPYVLAMSPAAPVPRAKDTGEKYGEHPVASGPYKLESDWKYGKDLVLVRNEQWDRATDPIRTALPDRIELKTVADQSAVDNALIHQDADLDAAQLGLAQGTVPRFLSDPELRKHSDATFTGGLRYLSIQPSVAPFDGIECRRAVHHAIDKSDVQTVLGGPDNGGAVATQIIPPAIPGYDPDADEYDTRAGDQPDEARRKLNFCGKSKGFNTKLAAPNTTAHAREVLEVVQNNLKAVGVTAEVELVDTSQFYQDVRDPKKVKENGWGIIYTGWSSDWPAPNGFLRPLVSQDSDYNYSRLNDWEINGLMTEAGAERDPKEAARQWAEVDKKIMTEAVILPLLHDRALNYRSPRLTNAYIHPALGGIDIQALGVSSTSAEPESSDGSENEE